MLDLNVSVLVLVVLVGLKVAVTPVGRPETTRATPLVMFTGLVTETVVLALVAPTNRLRLPGDADRPKDGVGTVNVMPVLAESAPEVPVIVTGYVPGKTAVVALNVTELDAEALAELKAAVTPPGKPEIVSATLPVNPF